MTEATIGDWVEISEVVLRTDERAPGLPPDTAAVPYTLRVRGFATSSGAPGDEVSIMTAAGHKRVGRLEEVNPAFRPEYGEAIPELIQARFEIKQPAKECK